MAEKKYTFTSMFKGNKEGTAVGYLEMWVTNELTLRDGNGKPVVGFAGATNNTHKELSYVTGVELPTGETTFIDVSAWEALAERIQKAKVRKGCLIGIGGVLKVEEYEGKKRLRLTANNFKVLVYPKTEQTETVPVGQTTSGPIEVSDDDLPF